MGKKKGKGGAGKSSTGRTRTNPLTGQIETISGTKAEKKRHRTSMGDPLRTHDIHGPVGKPKKKKETF